MDASQTTIYTAVLITGIIIGTIIIYFIVTIIRHQRRNNDLYKSKILAEITTLEKERARIASDLHDELGPILSSVKFRINSLDVNSEEDLEQLGKANQHIDEMIRQMREISNDLMPNTLIRKGLIMAMKEAINNMSKTTGLRINFNHENIPDLARDKSINLYRMLLEIIHNVIKHSKATQLNIEIKTKNQTLIVLTEDNGSGFDYTSAVQEKSGLGLRSLLSRTDIMGGEMFIESKPDKGTRYIFEIPLN